MSKPPENVEDIYALSPLQSGMLFHALYADQPGFYVQQQVYEVPGNLDSSAFERAWQLLIQRHPVLRTSFHWEKLKEPMQVVHKDVELPIETHDWRNLNPEEQRSKFEALSNKHREQDVEISRAPLMRLALVRVQETAWRLLWSYHHLIVDRWSVSTIVAELTSAYDSLRAGRAVQLPPVKPYRDYIRWLRQQDAGKSEAYWRSKLAGFTSPTSLPIDRAPAGHQGGSIPAEETVRLSESTTAALNNLARQRHLTINTLIQGAWALLLSRYTGERDVLFGATVSGRPASLPGVESMVGLFINSLPVRIHVPDDEPAITWLENLQTEMVELREYEHSSLVQIQGWSNVPRGTPLYDSLVVVQNTPGGFSTGAATDGSASGLRLRPVEGRTAVDFPLLLRVGLGRELRLTAAYDEERFKAEDIVRLLGQVSTVLESLAASPELPCSQIPMLSESEQRQILVEWNDTGNPYPDRRLHRLIEDQIDRTPDEIAVTYEGARSTYRQLDEQANRLAHYLRSLGIGPGSYVGVFMERSWELVPALLGVLKAGAAYVPLDPDYPAARIAFMLEDSQVPVILTQESVAGRLPQYNDTPSPSQLTPLAVCVDREDLSAFPVTRPDVLIEPEDAAYVIYTSGTTGRPKGVVVPHRAIVNHMEWMQETFPLGPGDHVLQKTPISFDASVWECWAPLMAGGELAIARPGGHMDSEYLVDLIQEQRITAIKLVPSLLRMLLEDDRFAGCHSLRRVFCGAEALPKELHDRFFAVFGKRAQLANLYGPTEAAIDAVGYQCTGDCSTPTVPIGYPIANCTSYILDRNLLPVPIGVPGELYLGGANVARGYLNAADLTADRFVPDPFQSTSNDNSRSLRDDGLPGGHLSNSSGQGSDVLDSRLRGNDDSAEHRAPNTEHRLYRTGDRCRYLPDGSIEFLGRVDHQVKIRGFRIELGEIESVLQPHSSVRECSVIVRKDSPGEPQLVAYVVGDSIDPSELRRHLKGELPDYMIPTAFVSLDALPLTAAGKLDRNALPAPDSAVLPYDHSVLPRTPIEEGLAEIWQSVLRLQQVGIHDNFFELGGHSLLATQVISRIRTGFQAHLPLRALFEAPTIAEMARRVEEARGDEDNVAPPLVPARREGPIPLSFAQQRLWFLDQLDPESTLYNIPTALRLTGELDIVTLERSLSELVRRHESLRTTLSYGDGSPCQLIHPPVQVSLAVVDLQNLADDDRAAEARRLIRAETTRPFNLSTGPLFRAGLLRLADDEHVLLITVHHIVSDAWSGGVLWRELAALYNAFLSDKPSPLPEPSIQYGDYAVWQRSWLQGEALERQIGYWTKRLAGAPALLELPTDGPRPPVVTHRGAVTGMEIPDELADKVRSLAQREGATLFMFLLAAFQTLLSRYSSQSDIVVGTPIANRTQPEIENVIGFFVNTLALRSDLSGDPTFQNLLAQVRNTCLEAYAHQDLPFEKIVDVLQPERSLSHSPIFQVAFVLQNSPRESVSFSGLQVQRMGGDSVTAKFDLTLGASQVGSKIRFGLEYNTDLFDADRMERLLGHYRTLLESVVGDPKRPISRLAILTEPEHKQLAAWNETAVEYPGGRCLHELFEAHADRTPNSPAAEFGADQLTYAQLDSRSSRLANYLRARGVGPETLVGICMDRSLEMIVAVLGVLKAGGAYVPLDPTYPAERLDYMARDSRAPLILTQRHISESLPGSAEKIEFEWDLIAHESDSRPESGVRLDNPAYVIYTSGSTGLPKGVAVTHRGIANLAFSQQTALGITSDDRVAQFASLSFDASVFDIVMALTSGACLVLGAKEDLLPGPPLTEFVSRNKISAATLPPTALIPLDPDDLPGLKKLSVAGEACPLDLARRWSRGRRFFNLYGPTETTIWATYVEVDPEADTISIGRPIPNLQVHILDRALSPVPVGVPGELCIAAEGLARGYLNRADLTAERFIPNPFASLAYQNIGGSPSGLLDSRVRGNDESIQNPKSKIQNRLYRTGDLARYLSDGRIEFIGRMDHQVKVRGFRIELGEIESALASHSGVQEAVVIARGDVPGEMHLAAYVVSANGAVSAGELRDHLRGKLPDHMIPHAFVSLDVLPLSPSGKVDRKTLPAPDSTRPEVESEFAAPVTQAEETLAGIWRDVLRLEQVGIYDNFFELGGDSILSIQIIARANQAGLRLTPRHVFQYQTIAGLAEAAGAGTVVEAEQGAVQGAAPLTPIQHWFFELDLPDPHHFNQSRLLQLSSSISAGQVKMAIEALVGHHDALRLRFERAGGEWVQSNAAQETNDVFQVIDLSHLTIENQSDGITAHCAQIQASLELARGPLIRAALLLLGEERPNRLFIGIHHLCVDGVSWRILLEDLETSLSQLNRGELVALPAKTSSFKRWAEKLVAHSGSAEVKGELEYWQSVVGQGIELPMDFPGGLNSVDSEHSFKMSIGEEDTHELLTQVSATYHTQIQEALLAALSRTLCQWTGGRLVQVDLEGHGREDIFDDINLSRTVGWFTSLYPIRLEWSPAWDIGEGLKRVKESVRSIPRRGIGYGLLRYLCDDARVRQSLSEAPASKISFNYHGQFTAGENSSYIRLAAESGGPTKSANGMRTHVIDVITQVNRDRLNMTWLYSENLHHRSTIESLAQNYVAALHDLIAHCKSSEAGGFTPSDFPEATVSQKSLDKLLAGMRKK